jgi:eukaryotic-like serine/threonine-protein kinase
VSDARWERIKATFEAALAVPAQDRPAILDQACGGDWELRREVESLLDARTQAFVRTAGAAHSLAAAITELAPSTERPGDMVGRYKLLEPLGEGGFGTVWMAEQREPVKRRVALKVIKLGMDTRQVIARFEAERQALAMMDHPNIAKVFDAGATETGRPYFVMEYIKGVPIVEYCDTAALDTTARLALFMSVCHAIQHAHQKGIIHRDIKPSNVLVTLHDGVPVPRVIDFGIAKATSSELTTKTFFTEHRQMIGTPAYMSPEQAEMSGLDIDTRSDIYSLGVLLYELLTGTTPFDSRSLMQAGLAEMMRIIREVEPHKPSTRLSSLGETGPRTAQQRRIGDVKKLGTILRGDLDWIVMKCLEKDRTRRYETANGLAADIVRHLHDEPVTAGAPSRAYRLRKFAKRHRAQVIAGGIVAGVLVLGVIGTSTGMVWALNEKTKATQAAESEATAKVAAQKNEQKAIAATTAAEAAREGESKARKRAETISTFVTTALMASDAQTFGLVGEWSGPGGPVVAPAAGTTGASHDMTILAAMTNAVRDIDSGRFKDDPETEAELRDTIGVVLRNNAKYDEAKPLLEKALAMRERLFDGDAAIVAVSATNLGELHYQQGHYDLAEPLLKRALRIHESALGPDHPNVAVSLNNLAVLYGTEGKYAQVESLLQRALAIREKALGPDDPNVANSLSNLAVFYGSQGQLARAEPLHERALAIRSKALGPDHPEVANTLYNLAALHRDQGQHGQAEPLYYRALAVYEKALGPDHPLVGTTLSSLGGLYQVEGQFARAAPLFTRSLAIAEKAYGPEHPSVAFGLESLAAIDQARGEYAHAEPLLIRATSIREKAVGPDHVDVAADLNSLAEICLAEGQYTRAEPLFIRALAIREKTLPPEHLDVATSLNNLAALHHALGEYAKAEPLFVRALAIREKALGTDNPTVSGSLSNLATLYYTQGQYAKAEPYYTRALEINERTLGPDDPGVATSVNNLATLYFAQRRYAEAEALYIRARAIFDKSLGPNHPNGAQSLSGLACVRQALGKTAEARQGFDEALATLHRLSPKGSPLLARVLWRSANARLENKDAVAALPEFEEAVAIAEKFLKPDHPHVREYRESLAKCRDAIGK